MNCEKLSLIDPMELACETSQSHYEMRHSVEFCSVRTTTTVTLLGGDWPEDQLRAKGKKR